MKIEIISHFPVADSKCQGPVYCKEIVVNGKIVRSDFFEKRGWSAHAFAEGYAMGVLADFPTLLQNYADSISEQNVADIK